MSELITKIGYKEDVAARKKILDGLSGIESEQKKLAKSFADGAVTSADYAKSVSKLNKETTVYKKALAPLDKSIKAQEKAYADVEKAAQAAFAEATAGADTLDNRLKNLDDSFSLISQQVGQAGDIESGIRTIGGAAGAIPGAEGLGSLAGGGAEIFAVIEAFPKLKSAAGGLPDIIQKTALSSSNFTATIATGLTPALGATGAAVAALSAVALPLIAAVGAISFAMNELKKVNEAAAEATRNASAARQAEIDVQREFAQLSDVEQVQERNRLFQESATLAEKLNAENTELARLQAIVADSAPLGARINGTRAALKAQEEIVNDLVSQSALANAQLTEANEQIADISQEELNRANNLAVLESIESDIASTESERASTLSQLEQATNRLTQIENQRTQAIEQRAQAETFAAQSAALEGKFAAEDQAEQNRELYAELETIASDGANKLAAIETDLANLRVERSSAIADVEKKGQDKLAAINQDYSDKLADVNTEYFEKQIEATDSFYQETNRLEEDNKRARLRLIQDIRDSLTDAQRSNDVLAFLTAQRDGARQLREQGEDTATAEKRRVEDFAKQQETAAKAQQERIAELSQAQAEQTSETLLAIETEKQQIIASYDERRAKIIEGREAEQQAIQDATQAAIARYNETEGREAQQAERQRQRDALREQQDEIRFQQQLDKIEETKQAELARLQEVETLLGTLETKIQNLNTQAQQITTQSTVPQQTTFGTPSTTSTQGSPFGFGFLGAGLSALQAQKQKEAALGLINPSGIAFANEGIATKPTLAKVGDRPGFHEAMINFKPSDGLPATLAQRGLTGNSAPPVNVSINMPVTVGDIATKSEVEKVVTESVEMVLEDFVVPLFENALAGKTS